MARRRRRKLKQPIEIGACKSTDRTRAASNGLCVKINNVDGWPESGKKKVIFFEEEMAPEARKRGKKKSWRPASVVGRGDSIDRELGAGSRKTVYGRGTFSPYGHGEDEERERARSNSYVRGVLYFLIDKKRKRKVFVG